MKYEFFFLDNCTFIILSSRLFSSLESLYQVYFFVTVSNIWRIWFNISIFDKGQNVPYKTWGKEMKVKPSHSVTTGDCSVADSFVVVK